MTNIPIFLSSDNNYAPFIATTIASICDNTKSFCDFYILDGGITKENQEKICELKKQFGNFSIEFIKIDLEKEFTSIDYKNISQYITLSTYNRFLIPKLKPELNKVLYLDVDIIVLGDIAELFNENLGNYALGAIREKYTAAENTKRYEEELCLAKEHKYFNAGILVINNKDWINRDILNRAFEVEAKYRKILKLADQDILNIIFNNNYQNLPTKYNVLNDNAYWDQNDESFEVLVRHYNGKIKPWLINERYCEKISIVKNVKDFWFYANKTSFKNDLIRNTSNELEQKSLQLKSRVMSMVMNKYNTREA